MAGESCAQRLDVKADCNGSTERVVVLLDYISLNGQKEGTFKKGERSRRGNVPKGGMKNESV